MDVVVDDHLLLLTLLGEEPAELRAPGAAMFTTGLWYHRLCRSLANPAVAGAMSRRLGEAEEVVGALAVRAITRLPDTIGLISLRELAWPMAALLDAGVRLNLLSLEAVAAAEHVSAELCLAVGDENGPLIDAAAGRGIAVRVIDAHL